ncbi:hypothetical protein EMPG_14097 [Blastomyces silverae]|uniref:Uncharacterized protein n=1 Tax=Blastomyces silverae TaxID=2060906 RepID=A0A0H1BG94_9EURO|nr:hypothetical protein EMPG_14097 [Blastomyces silverae]
MLRGTPPPPHSSTESDTTPHQPPPYLQMKSPISHLSPAAGGTRWARRASSTS